jgi:hypothetical protein
MSTNGATTEVAEVAKALGGDVDERELALILRRFPAVDAQLEAPRLAVRRRADGNAPPSLPAFESWLGHARPSVSIAAGPDDRPSGKAARWPAVEAKLRANLARARECVTGEPLTPKQIDDEVAYYRAQYGGGR